MLRNCKADVVVLEAVPAIMKLPEPKEDFIMELSDKIIKHRKANGWSQEDFAEKLNLSRQAISRWENGTALPDAQNILQISKLFQVTTDYLLNDDYENDGDIPAVKTAAEETKALFLKKKNLHLIVAIFSTIASLCWIIGMTNSAHDVATALFGFSFALSTFNAAVQFAIYFNLKNSK